MPNITQTLRTQFLSSIGDASQVVRLFDFLPNVFVYLKDTLHAITIAFSVVLDSHR